MNNKELILSHINSRITGLMAYIEYQQYHNTKNDVRLRSYVYFDRDFLELELNRLNDIKLQIENE